MFTESQHTEIRNYLLSKKLPIDILIEVNDHFVSQISDLQREDNLSFEDAFEKTKENWKRDFEITYPWYVVVKNDNVAQTRFEKKIRNEAEFGVFKISLFISVCIFLVLMLLLFNLDFSIFTKIRRPFMILVLGFALVMVFYNLIVNNFAAKEKYKDYRFSVYEWRTFFSFSLVNLISQFSSPIDQTFKSLLDYKLSFEVIFNTFLVFAAIFLGIYTGIFQLKLLQTLKKIKPFFEAYIK